MVAFTPLALAAAEDLPVQLPARLESSTRTDADGRFELVDVPLLPFVRVDVSTSGHLPLRSAPPTVPGEPLDLVLERLVSGGHR